MYMVAYEDNSSYCLAHHGIKGQKWGIRRYQNEDGSLTPEGEKRYGGGVKGDIRRIRDSRKAAYKELSVGEKRYLKKGDVDLKMDKDGYIRATNEVRERAEEKARHISGLDKNRYEYADATDSRKAAKVARGIGIGGTVLGAGLATVGGILGSRGDIDPDSASALISGGAGAVLLSLTTIGGATIIDEQAKKKIKEIDSHHN